MVILIFWIGLGIISGLIAGLLDEQPFSKGILGPVVLGIIGAMMGGILASLVFGVSMSSFDIKSFSVIILGVFVILAIRRGIHSF